MLFSFEGSRGFKCRFTVSGIPVLPWRHKASWGHMSSSLICPYHMKVPRIKTCLHCKRDACTALKAFNFMVPHVFKLKLNMWWSFEGSRNLKGRFTVNEILVLPWWHPFSWCNMSSSLVCHHHSGGSWDVQCPFATNRNPEAPWRDLCPWPWLPNVFKFSMSHHPVPRGAHTILFLGGLTMMVQESQVDGKHKLDKNRNLFLAHAEKRALSLKTRPNTRPLLTT